MSEHSLSREFPKYTGDLSHPLDRAVALFHSSLVESGKLALVGNDSNMLSKTWNTESNIIPLQYTDENGRTISVKLNPLGGDSLEVSFVPLNPRGTSQSFTLHMQDGLSTDISRLSFRNAVANCPILRAPGRPKIAICGFKQPEPVMDLPEPVMDHDNNNHNNNHYNPPPPQPTLYATPHNNYDYLSNTAQPAPYVGGYGGHELMGPQQLLQGRNNYPHIPPAHSPDQPHFNGPFPSNEFPHGGPSGPGLPPFGGNPNTNPNGPAMKPRFDPYGPYAGMGDPGNDMEHFPRYKKGPTM